MKSFESERFEVIKFNQTIQKVCLLGRGEEFMRKVKKSKKEWRECSQKLMSLSPIFSMLIFSSTEFSIHRILGSSQNVKVTSIKSHPRGFRCVCYSYIARSKVIFCQRGLLVSVYLCAKVNIEIAENSVFDLLQQQYEHSGPSRFSFNLSCTNELSKSETAVACRLNLYIISYI